MTVTEIQIALTRKGQGILKRQPGDKPFAEEWDGRQRVINRREHKDHKGVICVAFGTAKCFNVVFEKLGVKHERVSLFQFGYRFKVG